MTFYYETCYYDGGYSKLTLESLSLVSELKPVLMSWQSFILYLASVSDSLGKYIAQIKV